MKSIGVVLFFIGWLSVFLSYVCGIGYGLYLSGVVDLTLGLSAWLGFVLWVKMFFGGLVSLFVGVFLAEGKVKYKK